MGFPLQVAMRAEVKRNALGMHAVTELRRDLMSSPDLGKRFLTERDRAVFAAGGFGALAGFGKRPALLVVDVNWGVLRRAAGT